MKRFLINTILFCIALSVAVSCDNINVPEPDVVQGEGLITLELKNASLPKPESRATVPAEEYEKLVNHIDILIFNDGESYIPSTLKLHVRKMASELNGTTAVLGGKNQFDRDANYWVYVIANSELDESEFKVADFKAFCSLDEGNQRMFLTGHENSQQAHVEIPSFFLMDGVAYNTETEPLDDARTPFVLNDGVTTEDLNLNVTLKRAAAKIKINIIETKKGEDPDNPNATWVDFDLSLGTNPTYNQDALNAAGFYFRDLPYTTSVIGDYRYSYLVEHKEVSEHDPLLRNTVKYNGVRFDNHTDQDKVIITTYSYARDWAYEASMLGTSIVVNIPLRYHEYVYEDADGVAFTENDGTVQGEDGKWYKWVTEVLGSNYYQIPVSKTKSLARNGYYEVSVKISIPGGSEPGEPVELKPVYFDVHEWDPVPVNVGDETENPVYLEVNEEKISMYNISEDDNTLEFASSSPVNARVVNYYFENSSGRKIYRYTYDENGNITATNTQDFTYRYKDENGIPLNNGSTWVADVTAEATGLNGNIKINTDIPGDNAIRYVELEISNEEGLSKTVTVAIYPLEYITFTEGWYSYREDFGGTTYEICGDKYEDGKGTAVESERVTDIQYSASGSVVNANSTDWYVNWTSGTNFRSKYANKSENGSISIDYYSWNESTERVVIGQEWVKGHYETVREWDFNRWEYVEKEVWVEGHYEDIYENRYVYERIGGSSSGLDNPRMYNVHISAASNVYNVGAPKLNDRGVTDGSEDNAKLISPSFQLASQLGAYSSTAINDVRVAGDHCKHYVEAYKEKDKDGNYTGKIIHLHDWRLPTQAELKFVQIYQTYSPAMATVLTGDNYWAANGLIETETGELYNGTGTVSGNSYAERAIRCVRDAFVIPEQRTGADGKNRPVMKDDNGNLLPVE